MSKPLFSVLIANYNNAPYLQDALDSVYKQTYKNWEIIIVDDCSSDISLDIYKEIENDQRIRILYNEENKGAGFTKRKSIEKAKGEICGFLDPDDMLLPSAISDMVDIHMQHPEYSLVHSRHYYCDKDMHIQEEYIHGKDVLSFNPMFFNLSGEISHFCTFKKNVYDKTEGIDPYLKRAVDQDLYLKLYDMGKTLYYDKFHYLYRIHDTGISTTNNIDKALYWKWVVNINTARRRNINIENLFLDNFVPKSNYDYIFKEYWRLKKYKAINELLHKMNNFLRTGKITDK